MYEHSLGVLEFDKVISIVAGYAASEPGRAAVQEMLPARDRKIVEVLLRETSEFIQILRSGEHPPLHGILDLGQVIDKLGAAGSMLTPVELLHAAETLAAGRRVRHFFLRIAGRAAGTGLATPLLCSVATAIQPLTHIEEAVLSAIDERAEIKDSASPGLRKIRKQIVRTRDDILGRMSRILQDSSFQKVIQEPVITIRDDRYVLPLKPHFRQSLNGVVHGQSGSRATLFVEPLDVLEQNNHLAELRMEEREEIERILRELTDLLAQEVDAIRATIRSLTAIDAVYARARFGMEVDAIVPELLSEKRLRLRRARHPLLVWKQKTAGGRDVAPNDIELNEEQRALILSGPNAGGKTVVLKIVGLLSLMTQTGLPVTAEEGSELPCFGSIFADIGDEQSLEQDLSTFSSHVGHIAEILERSDADSLVLLDELGSGTDPGEGAALGAAVLESLVERGCMTLATTHHNTLKLFGAQTTGAVNAAMEFDPQTLKPTYRLIPGLPGRSYGLDMASRIGVPDDVIKKARARIGEDDVRLENLLKQVEADAHQLASDREVLEQELATARKMRNESEAALRAVQDEAWSIKAKAKTEAKEVVASLRQKLRELSRVAVPQQTEIKKSAAEIESLVRKLEPGVPDQEPGVSEPVPDLQPGDRVRIPRWNKSALVLDSQRGWLELDVDGKKLKLSAREAMPIEPLRQQQNRYAASGWSAHLVEREGSSDRLNLIGLRVNEGLAELERFIDGAGINGLSVVTIIHGVGTGALKTAVMEHLKSHPLIAGLRPGEPAEGGAGVTVAELKK
jgi:DNA mismatch repair protein MutS2